MFGQIKFISDNIAHIENINTKEQAHDLMNVHVIFESDSQKILGEVNEISDEIIKIRLLGEFVNDRYLNGVIRKPTLNSTIRIINGQELTEIIGTLNDDNFLLGQSAIYTKYNVCPSINGLFANHMAIFGNTGSGKSCGVARLVQNLFNNPNMQPTNANIFIFDAYGEYKTAFSGINQINPNYNYKFLTPEPKEPGDMKLNIPFCLLTLDDITLLLQASEHAQIPIIERTIRLVKIFAVQDETANKLKNHLIARALLAVLFSNNTTEQKKNDIFSIIKTCHTPEFNFDSTIQGLGYTRTFSECFEIDSNGYFGESVLITEYILKFINNELENIPTPEGTFYGIKELAEALEFTLISEGFQNNKALFDAATILKVRVNGLLSNPVKDCFDGTRYVDMDTFIKSLVITQNNTKAQIVNINIENMDDTYAKVIVKIMSRMLFEYAKNAPRRASNPYHLFLEEAHRYIHKDSDTFLIGYNIFERISKEGRKYGVLLNIISQRPVEISETVISQCSNFLIFKMTHPKDIAYIRDMLPNISNEILEKQKVLQPGTCIGFGSAFKIPMIVKMEMPNPAPNSNSCDVETCWKGL